MSKSKKQTGEEQVVGLSASELVESLKKEGGGKEFWSLYPFREGKIRAIYFDGNLPKYGVTQPLTQKQIDDVERIMQCRFEIESLRAFLSQNCNINEKEQFDNLTPADILRIFQRYYLNKKFEDGKAEETKNQQLAEKGGNATLKSKIKDFLWTLYEKTLKVVVDAVMERMWPK